MRTITTNLSNIINQVLGDKLQIVDKVTTTNKIEPSNVSHIAKVLQVWENLQLKLYNLFKEYKGSANMNDVFSKFGDELKFLNDNIQLDDIQVKFQDNYIRAFYGNKRIAQFSLKNGKLLPNEQGQGFLIWSVLGHITCNGKTGLCSGYCYNNSKSFDTHIQFKIDNLITSTLDIFEPLVIKMLQYNPYGQAFVRIHEDGDYYNMDYFTKWLNISKKKKELIFESYTKEPKLLKMVNNINESNKNFVLRFSLMEDTKKEIIEYVAKNNVPNYTVIGEKKKDKATKEIFDQINKKNKCVNSCKYCKKCYSSNNITIINMLH